MADTGEGEAEYYQEGGEGEGEYYEGGGEYYEEGAAETWEGQEGEAYAEGGEAYAEGGEAYAEGGEGEGEYYAEGGEAAVEDGGTKEEEYTDEHVIYWSRAIYDYQGQAETELSFAVGDVIGILSEPAEGWCFGLLNEKSGHFPDGYCEKVEAEAEAGGGEQQHYEEPYEEEDAPPPPPGGPPLRELTQEETVRRERRARGREAGKKAKEELAVSLELQKSLEEEVARLRTEKYELQKGLLELGPLRDSSCFAFDLIKLSLSLEADSDSASEVKNQAQLLNDDLQSLKTAFDGVKAGSPLEGHKAGVSIAGEETAKNLKEDEANYENLFQAKSNLAADIRVVVKALEVGC